MYKRKKLSSAKIKERERKSAKFKAKKLAQKRKREELPPGAQKREALKKCMPSSGYGQLVTTLVAPSPLTETSRVQGFLKQL